MRNSKTLRPPVPYVLLREILPEFCEKLEARLCAIGQRQIAKQVPELRIYGRCPCSSRQCGTFYCVPPEEQQSLSGRGHDVDDVTIAEGKIVRVETLDPAVDAVLGRMFPTPDRASGKRNSGSSVS